ncbi:MAG: iron-containing alcohol dehydrogenase family protein [Halanaeroarchaeum sp.]
MDDVGPSPISFTAPPFRFGDGVASELPETLTRVGISNPLVVTDRGIEEAGILETVTADVDAVDRYYATREPSTGDFEDLPDGPVDGVIAIGGGSSLDAGKIAALLLAADGPLEEYIGTGTVTETPLPIVAVPTTSGTGSQSTQTAVVKYDGVKRGISDESLRPAFALVDPTLTEDLPSAVTARSGFDALIHAVESFAAREYRWVDERPITYQGANPVSRPLSRRALDLVHGSLERAVHDGDDRSARRDLSLGAHLAGLAFSNAGLGAIHALASAVGGMRDRPHGECLAASLEIGLAYNRPVRRGEYAAMARHLGVGTDADAFVEELVRVRDSIGLPSSLADLGLDEGEVDDIVEATVIQERRLVTNPRQSTEELRSAVARGFRD